MQDAEESGLPDGEDNNPQERNETCAQDTEDSAGTEQDADNRVYLDLIPVRSFLHTAGGSKAPARETPSHSPVEEEKDPSSQMKEVGNRDSHAVFRTNSRYIILALHLYLIFCALKSIFYA